MANRLGAKYAWVIAASCFLAGVCTISSMFVYGYTVSYAAEDFGVTVASLAIATSLFGALSSGFGFIAGSLADRFGPRAIIGGGAIAVGALLIAVGILAKTPVLFISLYALAGAFAATLGGAIIPKLVSSWFAPNMRAKGMVVYTLGGSITGAVLGIAIPKLIIDFAWRGTFDAIGALVIVCGLLFLVLCRNEPADMDTVPLGSPSGTVVAASKALTDAEKAAAKQESRKSLGRVLKMPITWIFGCIGILWYCYFASSNTFQTAAILDAGYDITTAGMISSILMVVLACSQILFSSLSDRFMSRKFFLGLVSTICGSLFFGLYFILSMPEQNSALLIFYFCMIGLFSGQAAVMKTTMAELYPPDLRATGPGTIVTITLVGTFFGPLISAAVVNAFGGVNAAAYLFIGAAEFVSGLLILALIPKTGGRYGDPLAEKSRDQIYGT